ncbi:RfbB dTDP-D-glucose 4,6-dehydratase [Candidatus Nanopelagicaceae bacterium]
MRYFVTGGAGFIGSNYVEHLLRNVQGVTGVTIYDKFTYAANPKNYSEFSNDPRLSVVKGDICDVPTLESSIAKHDFVIHFAAESHVDRSIENGSAFVTSNVLGTYNILEASRNAGIKTIVHVSTDEVYGSIHEGSVNEEYPLFPNSPYSASKAGSDLLARSYVKTYGLDVRTTRSCNNYGKYQYPEKLVPVIIRKLSYKLPVPVYGDGTNVREWIHVQDNCRAIQLVLEEGSAGATYNIGTGQRVSNLELIQRISSIMGMESDLVELVSDRLGHDFRYALDSSSIANLGFEPKIDFDFGLKLTIDWYLNNNSWWV